MKDENDEDKKNTHTQGTKKGAIKRKLKFQYYQNCLEPAQIENKIKRLEKNKSYADNLKYLVCNREEIRYNNTIQEKKKVKL